MLAIAISLLFGFTAFAALGVVHVSLVAGAGHARRIRTELAAMDRADLVRAERARVRTKGFVRPALQPMLAAA